MKLAPILVQVYNRKSHFVNCVESLAKCRLANQSHLIIASDAPKTEKDKQAVDEIRRYCRAINGFGKVELMAYEKNLGVLEAFECAKQRIFSEYDTMIYTEDDNIFSSNFLEFINQGLMYYQNNAHIFAICGYRHPFKMPQNYVNDVFTSTMFSAWGYGIWKEKYLAVDFYPKDFKEYKHKARKKMSKAWFDLMDNVISKGALYGDVIMEYHCLKNNMVNVFPVISLVQNHGTDGSGMHSSISPKYAYQEVDPGYKTFTFVEDQTVHRDIEKRLVNAIDFPFQNSMSQVYLKLKYKTKKIIKNILLKHPVLQKYFLSKYKINK